MRNLRLLFTVLTLLQWISCYAGDQCYYLLEAQKSSVMLQKCEDTGYQPPCIHYRSRASSGLTVLLMTGQTLSFHINSIKSSHCAISVKDITYSNDGHSDTVSAYLNSLTNDSKIGEFVTDPDSRGGDQWNVMKSSGQVGDAKILLPQENSLIIEASYTDDYDVELDTILVLFTCDDECPVIPNHRPLEPPKKPETITFTTCLGYITTAIGFFGFFLSLIGNIYSCYKCYQNRRRSQHVDNYELMT